MGCGAEIEANQLMEDLKDPSDTGIQLPDMTGEAYNLPAVFTGALYTPVTKLSNNHLSEQKIDGNGTFDILMRGFAVHLQQEFEKGRITGENYAKVYIELTQAAMGNAVQYLLGREQAYWAAVASQLQAQVADAQVRTARVELETAKIKLQAMKYEALTQQSAYALNKMQLSTASIAYCTAKYNLDNMLPKQLEQLTKNNTVLQNEIDLFPLKQTMLREQGEAQRAQTQDTRTDGLPITGTLGKQRELYDQQITSYQRDAEIKAAKPFIDAWITMKTVDEGLVPPAGFTNASLDTILTRIKLVNNLDTDPAP